VKLKFLEGRRIRIVALVTAAATALSTGAATAYADATRDQDPQPNMIGGNAPTQDYPAGAFVNLNYDAPSHGVYDWFTCGATAISGNTFITSAHCVTDPPAPEGSKKLAKLLSHFPDMQAQYAQMASRYPAIQAQAPIPTKDKQFFIRAGFQDRTAGERMTAYVVWVDPEWDWITGPNPVNDIAVVKIAGSLDLQPVPLGDGPLKPGTEVWGLGWGLINPDWSESIPTMIQEIRSTVLPTARCADAIISTRDLCVNNPYGTDGPCSGDSGGPLLAWDARGVLRLYGNLSRFYGPTYCGESPYIYTSTSEFRKEIYDAARLPIPTQRKAQPEPTYTTKPAPVSQERDTVQLAG
jgi:hypothetical protein